MSITLNTYSSGDTDYVSKMNNDNATLLSAVNQLLGTNAGATVSAMSAMLFLQSVLGNTPFLLTATSYQLTASGTSLQVSTGTAWNPATQTVVQMVAPVTIQMAGQAAGTYYLQLDKSGNPSVSASSSGAFYSLAWDGATTISAVTMLATIYPPLPNVQVPTTTGAPTSTPAAGTTMFDPAEGILYVRGTSGWFKFTGTAV